MSKSYFHYKAGEEPIAGHRLVEFLGGGGFGEVWKVRARAMSPKR